MASSLEAVEGRCCDLEGLLSVPTVPDSRHMTFLPTLTVEMWTDLLTEFCQRIWHTCHTISPQEMTNDLTVYEDPACVAVRNLCQTAKNNSRRKVEVSVQFIRLSAEEEAKSQLKDALTKLLNQSMTWDSFTRLGDVEETSSQGEILRWEGRCLTLFTNRSLSECRKAEKTAEKTIAETLMAQGKAILNGYNSLVKLAPPLRMWCAFLRGEKKILEDFVSQLFFVGVAVKRQLLAITDYVSQTEMMSEAWESPMIRESRELMESVKMVRVQTTVRLSNFLRGFSNPATFFNENLVDLTEMTNQLMSFQSSEGVLQQSRLVSEMKAVLHRANYVLQKTASPILPVAAPSSVSPAKMQPSSHLNSTQYFTAHRENVVSGSAPSLSSSGTSRSGSSCGTVYLSPAVSLDLSDRQTSDRQNTLAMSDSLEQSQTVSDASETSECPKSLDCNEIRQKDDFYDSLNVSGDFSDAG